jgi:hypothetical protein
MWFGTGRDVGILEWSAKQAITDAAADKPGLVT